MKNQRVFWKIFPLILLVTMVALGAITWVTTAHIRTFYQNAIANDLRARAEFMERYITDEPLHVQSDRLVSLSRELGKVTGTRITLISSEGVVIADSDDELSALDNHLSRPEVVTAMHGGTGLETRFSQTRRIRMMYVTIPIYIQNRFSGVVRTALPLTVIEEELTSVFLQIGLAAAVILLIGAGASLFLARKISRPLEELRRGAERFRRGELGQRLPVEETEEIGALAESMNSMAGELNQRIRSITHERAVREAILSSMVECVLAVDGEEKILHLNQAAADLFGILAVEGEGRMVQEVVRISSLLRFIISSLAEGGHHEAEITLYDVPERVLKVRACPLAGQGTERGGTLLVFRDVTHLRRLERMRSEFVGNVSHELRTPITVVKGFAETLLDGDLSSPVEIREHLEIIHRQADRLVDIIEDLLSLSRVEREEGENSELHPVDLTAVVKSSLQTCELSAKRAGVHLQVPEGEYPVILGRESLLEQALVNLLNNAIKYSNSGTTVKIEFIPREHEVELAVVDQGCGILAEHLPRLFERFYRVDKGRSRHLGGTGLGLAIVKHIAQLHRGRVEVKSRPGTGSTFSIYLPLSGRFSDTSAGRIPSLAG